MVIKAVVVKKIEDSIRKSLEWIVGVRSLGQRQSGY